MGYPVIQLIACLVGLLQLGEGYKLGAPLFSCKTMTPGHGATAQTVPPPYKFIVEQVGEPESGRMRVNLMAPRTAFLVGFLIQARPTNSEEAVGTFVRISTDSAPMNCGNSSASAITQKINSRKKSIDAEWEAPLGFYGDIQFLATVVLNYTTFWVSIPSEVVQINRRSLSDSSQDPALPVGFPKESELYDGCDQSKNCMVSPPNCLASRSCNAFGSIRKLKDDAFVIELFAKDSKYVAMGFSNDTKMGGDSVVECVVEDDNTIRVFRSWNVPNAKKNIRREEYQNGINLMKSEYADGLIYCKVLHTSKFSVYDAENFVPVNFDLENNEYHTLLAAGTSLKSQSVGYHDVAFTSSPNKKVLSNYGKVVQKDVIYDDCNVRKNCFGIPEGCISSQTCTAVVTIAVEGMKYIFEMKANSAQYVAVGLSDDDKMGGDSVIECVHEGDSSVSSVRAYTSWNVPGQKSNERQGSNGITFMNGSHVDGTIYCKVIRDQLITVKGKTFNLAQDEFNILLAAGSSLKASGVGYHDLAFAATAQKKALSNVGAFSAGSKLYVRLHGAFMISAWIGAASIGIVLARYYKQTWVGSRLCTKDQWFAWHRFLMALTWLLSVSGGTIIFYDVGGWVTGPSQTHALLGVITTSLAFLQPIGAYLRPHPESSKRFIFNWLHWLIGNAAHIIGIVTIFLAVELGKAELPKWTDWILVAYVAFYVLIHLILSVSGCMSEQQKQQRVNSFPMKDMHLSRGTAYPERKSDAPYSGFRKLILFWYVLIIVAISALLVSMVIYAPVTKNWSFLKDYMPN